MHKQERSSSMRFFGFILVLATVATVILAACGGSASTPSTATGSSNAAVTDTPQPTVEPTATDVATPAPTATPTVAPTAAPTAAPAAVQPTTPPPPPPPTQAPAPPPMAKTVQITITTQGGRFAFSPASITISKGTKVVWVNNTHAPHTVTSNNGQFTSSGTFGSGGSFATTFATAGTFSYHCAIHTYMVASVTVTA